MAARESQGLQFGLIFFVIVTVVMIVVSFLMFSKYRERDAALQKANADLNTAKQQADEAQRNSRDYRTLIGAAEADKDDAVRAAVAQEIEAYSKNMPDSERNYRSLVRSMGTELNNRDTRIAKITANEKEMSDKMKANDEAKKADIARLNQEVEKAKADLLEVRGRAQQVQNDAEQSNKDTKSRLEARARKSEDSAKNLRDDITKQTSTITGLEGQIRTIKETVDRQTEQRKMPDGHLTGVNQGQRIVFLNRGSDDGLRPQLLFTVVSQEDTNPATAPSKGKIEVIRIDGPHMAEARIIEDNLKNPLLPGDLVFNPVWEAGRPDHFALAGVMDIDGDGKSDRQKIRDLIALHGGIIDAEVPDDGRRTGKLSIETTYLILGAAPISSSKDDEAAKPGYDKIIVEAKDLGVHTMSVKDFMDTMGFKVEDRSVNLGAKTNKADFKPRFPDGRQPTTPVFKSEPQRRPTPAPIGY